MATTRVTSNLTVGLQLDLAVPSQAEAEAGTATTERVWTAERVKQAVLALAAGGGDLLAANNLSDVVSASTALVNLGAQADLAVPSQAEAEAGTATIERVWTAERVKQAILALAAGGGDLLAANNLSDVLSAATSRTNLGLAIGTSGDTIPKNNTANIFSADQTIASANALILGAVGRFKYSDTATSYAAGVVRGQGAVTNVNYFTDVTAVAGRQFLFVAQADAAATTGDKLAIYGAMQSGTGGSNIWGVNGLVNVNHSSVSSWASEWNVNYSLGSDAPDPRTTGHSLGCDAVSGGSSRPTVAFSTFSSTLANRWRYGLWFDNIGGTTPSALINAGQNISVDYGIDLEGAAISASALRIPNTNAISWRNAAGTSDLIIMDVDAADQLVIGRDLTAGKFVINATGTLKIVSEGAIDSGGAGFKVLRVPN